MTDRIEKQITLAAPVGRVWRALTDAGEFGAWFGVRMNGAFVPGRTVDGELGPSDCGAGRMEVCVQAMEAERLFSFTWHPYALDPAVDYAAEPSTLVTFTLAAAGDGTLLTVTESGFDALPAHRRDIAWRKNDHGWAMQMDRIATYLAGAA